MFNFFRTLVVTASLAGAILLGFWKWTSDNQAREIAARDRVIADMTERLEERTQMIHRLSRSRRIGHIEITDQRLGLDGLASETDVTFIELDDDENELARQSFTIPGNVLFVDAWTVKFAPEAVAVEHPLQTHTLVLLRRIYSDQMAPRDGFPIDTPGAIPPGYAGSDAGRYEQQLWAHFWEIASDARLAQAMGVRVAQGDAAYKPVHAGEMYDFTVDAIGGISLHPHETHASGIGGPGAAGDVGGPSDSAAGDT